MTDKSNDSPRKVGEGRWVPTVEDPLGRNQPPPKQEQSDNMTQKRDREQGRKRDDATVSDSGRRSESDNDRYIDQMRQYYQDRERDRDREDRRRSFRSITRLLTIIVALLVALLVLVALIGMGGLFFGADEAAGSDEGFAGDVDTGSDRVDVFVETVTEVVVEVIVEPAMEFVIYVEQLIIEYIEIAVEYVES